jgi:hypothetical protein
MCIKINKIGKQEVGIWWVQKRFPQYDILIWSLWPNIRFLPSMLSKCWWQKSDVWSQVSYRYTILWVAFLYPSDSYFLFACMLNVYKNQQNRQAGSRNLMGPKTLPTIWHTYMTLVTKHQISAINSYWEKCDEKYLGRNTFKLLVYRLISKM